MCVKVPETPGFTIIPDENYSICRSNEDEVLGVYLEFYSDSGKLEA